MIKEIAIDTINIAKIAVGKGANRIEVCSDLKNDGLTPTKELFLDCKKLNVPCFAMIRPKKGDFTVSREVFLIMKKQIKEFKELNVDGFVLGILTSNNEVDIERVQELVDLANPLPVTFHKAVDVTKDIFKASSDLLKTGVKRILTSGGKQSVSEGMENIKRIYEIVGNKIILVAGGKVTYNNIERIKKELPFCEFHGRNIVKLD